MTLIEYLSHFNVQDRKAIQAYADTAFALGVASAEETYTDENGTVWNRPTAWAYAQACKALAEHKRLLEAVTRTEPLTCQEVRPDWNNRDTKTLDGWINELGTLSEHRDPMAAWMREALGTIYRGLTETQQEVHAVARAALEYIDAIPKDIEMPAMPGFDRDWADSIMDSASRGKS